jgi:hypothetical protein
MGLTEAIIGHLVGDFLLQNDWMAANKKKNSWVCLLHCLIWTAWVCCLGARRTLSDAFPAGPHDVRALVDEKRQRPGRLCQRPAFALVDHCCRQRDAHTDDLPGGLRLIEIVQKTLL